MKIKKIMGYASFIFPSYTAPIKNHQYLICVKECIYKNKYAYFFCKRSKNLKIARLHAYKHLPTYVQRFFKERSFSICVFVQKNVM